MVLLVTMKTLVLVKASVSLADAFIYEVITI